MDPYIVVFFMKPTVLTLWQGNMPGPGGKVRSNLGSGLAELETWTSWYDSLHSIECAD